MLIFLFCFITFWFQKIVPFPSFQVHFLFNSFWRKDNKSNPHGWNGPSWFWYTVLLTVTNMLFSNIWTFMITSTLYIFIAMNKSIKSIIGNLLYAFIVLLYGWGREQRWMCSVIIFWLHILAVLYNKKKSGNAKCTFSYWFNEDKLAG